MAKRERRVFTEEFKQQIVQLYQNGKPRQEIIREYADIEYLCWLFLITFTFVLVSARLALKCHFLFQVAFSFLLKTVGTIEHTFLTIA